MVWMGHGYYTPNNREWKKHHEVKALPTARVPDQIEFQNEDSWREWQRKRDTPGSGKACASYGKIDTSRSFCMPYNIPILPYVMPG